MVVDISSSDTKSTEKSSRLANLVGRDDLGLVASSSSSLSWAAL